MYVTWTTARHVCDMTPCTAYAWHYSALHMCDMTPCSLYVWHDSLHTICVTRLLSLGGMILVTVWHGKHRYTKSCARKILMCVVDSSHRSPCVLCTLVWHEFLCDVTLCVSWMLVCDMNVCVWHECLCVTWMFVCDMNAYVWHGFFPYDSMCDTNLCVIWLFMWHECLCVTWMPICDMDSSHIWRGGGLGSSTIFKKFNEPYAPS